MDIKAQILKSAQDLEAAWVQLQPGSETKLPAACREQWIKRASMHSSLRLTAELIDARTNAWNNFSSLKDSTSREDNKVTFGSLRMDYAIARHLSLVCYMTTTWAVYDRLANICGRLASTSEISSNPKQNPKVCEQFLHEKGALGFEANHHIKHAYSWPLKVSYKIRNWVAHEGFEQSGIPLFAGNNVEDGFLIHPKAAELIENTCEHRNIEGAIAMCCISAAEEAWPKRDLMAILPSYHSENDIMFQGLVKWSVESFIGQISAFAARDRSALLMRGPSP